MFKTSDKVVTSGKLNITISEFLQDIPNIILLNFDCTENCEWTSEVGNDPILIWKKGNRYSCTNKGLELFSKTKEGKKALGLFMKNNSKIYSYTSNSEGKYNNKHTLMFVENDYTGNFGHTAYKFKKRFPEYTSIDVSNYASSGLYPNIKILSKKPKSYYTMIQIHLYPNSFLESQKENKWTDTRLNAQIAHTIAHEIFIHAYRKGIPLMESWGNNFDNFDEIYNRDTGESGDFDHAAYIQNHKDEGLNLMREFQKSLSEIIGYKMFKEVKKYHDKKYYNLKNTKIPE